MSVPNIFANDSGSIPLSELDANFAYLTDGNTVLAGAKQLTGSLAVVKNAGVTTESDFLLNLNRLVNNPTDALPYDALAAGEYTITGTAVVNGGGVLSFPCARTVYAGITSNFNGATSQTSAVSGFNQVTDGSISAPPLMWGAEFHVSKASGVADSQMIGCDVQVHKAPALGAAGCVGVNIASADLGSFTATRAGVALQIGGARGWTQGIVYNDINGTTNLFTVDQHGLGYFAGGLEIPLGGTMAIGTTPQTTTGFLVTGAVTTTGTVQSAANFSATTSSAATSLGAAVIGKVTTAAASFTQTSAVGFYSSAHVKGAGSTISTAYGIFLETQTVGNTNLLIGSTAGATLTTSGVWTNAPSWAVLKDITGEITENDSAGWLEWVRDGYRAVTYRYHGKDGGPVDQAEDHDHLGFLLDEVPEHIRKVVCANDSGAISTKDFDGFLLTVCQQLARDNAALLRRVEALEARGA